MPYLDEIKKMRAQGLSQQEIANYLQQSGLSQIEIDNLISQVQIKEAVTAPSLAPPTPSIQEIDIPQSQQEEILPSQPMPQEYQQTIQPSQETYSQETYPQQSYDQQYQYPQLSTDTITEIAEQVVSEKLAKMHDMLEKTIDFKTTAESKLSHLSERLQRIEKIIDTLQLSILQKVGEYTTDVSDLKKELVETQKSFKAISSKHPSHMPNSTKKHKHLA